MARRRPPRSRAVRHVGDLPPTRRTASSAGSRAAHRKHHNRLDGGRGSTWWAPGAVGWWIGVLFMVGSPCFARRCASRATSTGSAPIADNVTFFVGSLFFTSAAALQYLEVVNAEPGR